MLDGLSLQWSWQFGTVAFLLVISVLYCLGLLKARGRGSDFAAVRGQIIAFFAAVVLAALVLLSPLNTIARTQLFLAHALQFVLLSTVCAPLMLAGLPSALLAPLLNLPGVRIVTRIVTFPLLTSLLFNLAFFYWHLPGVFAHSLADPSLYQLQMVSLLLLALLNWWPLMGSVQEFRRMRYPWRILYTFLDGQPIDIFALLLILQGVIYYPIYAIPPQLGLTAQLDQGIGGGLLLIPGLVDLCVMTGLFVRWLAQIEQKTRQDDLRRQELAELEEYEEVDEEEFEEDEADLAARRSSDGRPSV